MQKSNDFLNDKNGVIVLNITGLNAYRDYTVEVRAVNKAGFGVTNTTGATTQIGGKIYPERLPDNYSDTVFLIQNNRQLHGLFI